MRSARPALSCLLLLALAGCAMVEEETQIKGPLYWPPLPEQPRFAYEASLYSSANITSEDETTRMRRLLTGGSAAENAQTFRKPYGIAVRKGNIYVSDTEARAVHVLDLPRRKWFHFGYRDDAGKLRKPIGIALDGEMNVYVADATATRINMYDGLGLFIRSFGSKDDLVRPSGVAVARDGSRIYAVDSGTIDTEMHRVVAYDKDGNRLFVIGTRGDKEGEFNLPMAAATAPDGTLYVLDSGNFRVQAFDPDGKFLRTWGSAGDAFGQFSRPRSIAVDDEGLVYVTDASFCNVQVFTPEGELLLDFGDKTLKEDGQGKLALPAGIAADETGRIYIVDQLLGKIEVIRKIPDAEGKKIQSESR